MTASRDATIFMDLSFLSPEEEEIIHKVLVRDEHLKRRELGRVRQLRESVPDPKQMKVLSGEWFEDLKSKRYGRQPHVSAVVRSSIRWKKSAGHKPNPFLNAVPEDKNEEKNKTRPNVSTDPRLIHPALSIQNDPCLQVQQENKDEAMVLEESAGAKPNTPVLKFVESGCQSGVKVQDQIPIVELLKLEPIQESKPKPTITEELDTKLSEPGTTAHEKDRRAGTSLETRPKGTDKNASRNFEMRSFSKAQDSPNWEMSQLSNDDESNRPESEVEVVLMNSKNSMETELTNKQNNPKPEVLFEEVVHSPIQKKRSGEAITVINIPDKRMTPAMKEELSVGDPCIPEDLNTRLPGNNVDTPLDKISLDPVQKGKEQSVEEIVVADFKQRSSTKMVELSVALDVEKDPDIFEDPVNNVNTAKCLNWDAKGIDPVQKGKERALDEIITTDLKQRSPTRMEELYVDLEKDPDTLKDPVNNVNTAKCAKLDPSLIQNGKERAVEEIIIADVKRRSPTRTEDVSVDLDFEKDPDLLEGHVSNANIAKCLNWDSKGLDPVQKGKERAEEDIIFADFKQRSPTRVVELSVDSNEETNSGITEDLKAEPVHGEVPQDEVRLEHTKRAEFPESVLRNERDVAAGGKSDFDVEWRESESANHEVSKEMEEIGEPEHEDGFQARKDESEISESNILASVYARATRPKSGVSKTPFAHDPMQKSADMIPNIVIMPSESEEPKVMECVRNATPGPEALVEVGNPGTDTWEDEGVDSDEDSSSSSSHDSDLSGKRGQLSASTLSVTERTASLLSVYSDAGDFGNVAVQGSVEFAIMYSPLGELVIMVEQCQDLAIANPRKQRTDPYVKTYLYPDKRSKRKTSIKKRTVNPVYVESLRYKVKREAMHGRTLNLSVWHNDSRGRNAFLGQVEINLKDWDWKHEALTWYNLQPKNADNQDSQENPGVLCVSLKYVPPEATGGSRVSRPTGEIHIWLREARHLRRLKTQAVDSFVKCYMLPDTSKKGRQKTRVVKKTQDPVYNHTMVYDGFRTGEVCEACCELTVWDHNTLSNQFLGGARLSLGTGHSYGKKVDWMDSENEEVEIWKKMMANPDSWVEVEIPLRSSMTPRK